VIIGNRLNFVFLNDQDTRVFIGSLFFLSVYRQLFQQRSKGVHRNMCRQFCLVRCNRLQIVLSLIIRHRLPGEKRSIDHQGMTFCLSRAFGVGKYIILMAI